MNSLAVQKIQALDNLLNRRYADRLKQFGSDPRTLGWDTRDNQRARFKAALRFLPAQTRSVVDFGCGLADFYEFFCSENPHRSLTYTGVDINPQLIGQCRERFPQHQFIRANILLDPTEGIFAQWGLMFGVLNFRLPEISNDTYAKEMIAKAYSLLEEGLIVDMLSFRRTPDYPQEDFVYYYSPAKMLEFAFTLTPYVDLIHDYGAIPQREFILVLRKRPCK